MRILPGDAIRLRIRQLTLSVATLVGLTCFGHGQDAPPELAGEAAVEAAITVEERARHILEAEQISALELNPIAFLGETGAVLSELIAKGSAAEAITVLNKALALIHTAEEAQEWGIQFSDRMTAGGFFANRLISGRVVPEIQPGLEHADFALTAVRTISDEGIFLDRASVGMLIGSTAGRALYSPTSEAVKTALDRLEAGLSEENAALAMPGYDTLVQRLASDEDELKEMLAALQREATVATSPKRTAVAREMLIVGQMRLARIGNDATMAAGYADYFLERINSPGLPAMARMFIAETVLSEWGDLLPLPVHLAGWDAMAAGMEEGAVLPAQARALLSHASTHAAHPEFRGAFGKIVVAWASRFQSDFSAARSSVAPNPEGNALLGELVDLCVQSGNASELAMLASVPVSNADIPWLLTVLEHAQPKVAADYFVRFAPEFDLRSSNLQLEQCVYKKDVITAHLPQVAASIDDPALRWLLQVTLAGLPNQPLTSPSDTQTSRERERRLADLADEHKSLDFESAPELEMAALRWFTEEPEVTKTLTQAYAKAGATIRPQEFASALANSDTLVGKRRIVGTWLGQSLTQGPDSVIGFLDALPSSPESFAVAMTVGELMSSVHQAFDDESANWSTELRQNNLVVFRTLLARPELGSLNRAFSGRFAAVGLIYHAVEGEAQTFDATWSALASPQRTALLTGSDDFLRWFESLLQNSSNDRSFSIAEMEATTRSINDSVIYQAMSDESFSGSKLLFKELLAANIATEELLCRIGPELILSNPRNGYAAEELAGIQEKAGQIDAAIASWDVAIAAVPETNTLRYTDAFRAKANLLERSARFADALDALKALDSKRLDKTGKAAFQNSLKELRILVLSEKRNAQELLKFAASGLELQPDSTQGRLSAAAVFRALRLKAQAAGNEPHAWAFGFLAAQTLAQLERDEKDSTGGRLDSALQDFNAMHVALGKPGGIVVLIPKGHAWRYTTVPQSDDWMKPSADDTSWLSGPAPLGYGSSNLRTSIDLDSDRRSKPLVTYFRTKFFLRANETVQRIAFDLLRDDAAVVYLNGEEVRRDNLPNGPLTATTLAVEKTSGRDESLYFPGPFATERLLPGENTLAIAVHQYDPASSDLIFDVELVINDLGKDTALKAVAGSQLQEALGPLWLDVPESIRTKVRRD